jgi:hypothetical protein
LEGDLVETGTVMVVHGPEVFDRGDVLRLRSEVNPGRIVVAGVMARTAAEESGIPCEFGDKPPSIVIRELEGNVFLANHAKTGESGRIFGGIIAGRLGDRGLVHVECASRIIFRWNGGDPVLSEELSNLTGFPVEAVSSPSSPCSSDRIIRGCLPGEPVFINGLVIGWATGTEVALRSHYGSLIPVYGLIPKPHGIEKVSRAGFCDLAGAWCKSGMIRTLAPAFRDRNRRNGRVLLIDHCGHELYRRMGDGVCGIVSVGDDTTVVCGHITTHRGIPVFGIVDGDADHILEPAYAPGSVVVHVLNERDDDIGAEIAHRIDDRPVQWDEFVEDLLTVLGDRVRVVTDTRE